MGRYTHDGAGAVICQDIIRNPDRCLFAVQRIHRIASGKLTGLVLVIHGHTIHIGLVGCHLHVALHCLTMLLSGQLLHHGMLRCQHKEGSTMQSVRSGCKHGQLLIRILDTEVHLCAVGAADPLGLHLLYLLRPVQLVQIIQKTIRIGCDLQHPLTQVLLGHRRAAALTLTVHYLLIGETGLAAGAPIDREFLLIGKSLLEHLHENPLGPLVELRICGIQLHIPVIERIDLLQLTLDVLHILLCGDGRMNAHLDGIVLSRKSEGIPAHGMDHILALDQLVTGPGIGDHIASPVSYMQAGARRIRKHIQTVVLLLLAVVGIDGILIPVCLPLLFYRFMIESCHGLLLTVFSFVHCTAFNYKSIYAFVNHSPASSVISPWNCWHAQPGKSHKPAERNSHPYAGRHSAPPKRRSVHDPHP